MSADEDTEQQSAIDTARSDVDRIVRSLAEQFEVAMGKPERVQSCCANLLRLQSSPPSAADADRLLPTLPLLASPSRELVLPLFELVERTAASTAQPWPLLKGLLGARDKDLAARALTLTLRRVRDGSVALNREALRFFAHQAELPGSPLAEPELLPLVGDIVRLRRASDESPLGDPLVSLLMQEEDGALRDLAGRILDSFGEPIPPELAHEILGAEGFSLLGPYLTYTRAAYRDVLSLSPQPHTTPPALASIARAHQSLGEELLRKIIAKIGWQRLSLGIEFQPYDRVASGESFPLMLHPAEATLARRCGRIRRADEFVVVTAHGGAVAESDEPAQASEPARLFRDHNLLHAQLLGDFLAVAPLTLERIKAILGRMDSVVQDFVTLFSSLSDECGILPGIYGELKRKIAHEIESEKARRGLSLELTRLVMMFEDPQALGRVQTLHGLKRYLHQKGLQLGFKLVQRSLSTNRTVDVLIVSRNRIVRHVGGIRYSDFEGETDEAPRRIPYPVRIVADGFARQAVVGHEAFPRVDIFCYGNEVHYFLAYKNHPAFLRINFAPPFQGGMIDLEYYGVSKYELAEHPDLSLPALHQFFRRLEFDTHIENTRVHARYDKEQAPDLRSLREKAEAVFRLAPYLLDIDWTIGGLKLNAEARMKVAAAWASFFEAWGVLPLRHLLSADRRSIVESVAMTPTGRRQNAWSGEGPYQDRFKPWPGEFLQKFVASAEEFGIEITPAHSGTGISFAGQIQLEHTVLRSLRQGVARGELTQKLDGYAVAPAELVERLAPPEHFAAIIASGAPDVEASESLAPLVAPLERILPFRTVGSVEGCDVQSASLPLKDHDLGVHVLRDEHGTVCLAFYTHGDALTRSRAATSEGWTTNALVDATEFASILRRADYPAPVFEVRSAAPSQRVRDIREMLAHTPRGHPRLPIPGEQTIAGLRASPGRFSGRALFGTRSRQPEDLEGAVLVTQALRPEDSAYLYHASGVVTTGGGILSHAGLLAAQFRKPAIIVGGRWEEAPSGRPRLRCVSADYDEMEKAVGGYRTTIRMYRRERHLEVQEGDLLALESGEDVVRVLGQDAETLDFHEGIRQLAEAEDSLGRTTGERDVLSVRGRRIRARHHLDKVFRAMTDPALTCHALSELLLGRPIAPSDRLHLLRTGLSNPRVCETALGHLRWVSQKLFDHWITNQAKARRNISDSGSLYEILHLRLEALKASQTLTESSAPLEETGQVVPPMDLADLQELEELARGRLAEIREALAETLYEIHPPTNDGRARHLVRELERLHRALGEGGRRGETLASVRVELSRRDEAERVALSDRCVLWPGDGGLELYGQVGWKAANLGEIRRLAPDLNVPPWFAVTDSAFRRILDSPIGEVLPPEAKLHWEGTTVMAAIESVLRNARLTHAQQSSQIRNLWESIELSEDLVRELTSAYRKINESSSLAPNGTALVALRSSSHEEDAEFATRAGEFETFLFIQGDEALLTYLKRTWSGLWSERSLHHRSILKSDPAIAGGGVIVQAMVDSRVSGVVQTVNLAVNDFREIVINAGLGLGMGIVSGTVAADHIVVAKGGDPEGGFIRFRYETAEKREYVVFDKRSGIGTLQCEAPFHQRRRPALEYAELCELVAAASRLEHLYGYPLDIEFGIEGGRLWILQARPVPQSLSAFQETLEHHPLTEVARASHVI